MCVRRPLFRSLGRVDRHFSHERRRSHSTTDVAVARAGVEPEPDPGSGKAGVFEANGAWDKILIWIAVWIILHYAALMY
jgi:hypothetical protein